MKTKTKKILTIVLLLAIASSVTIFALVTMQSPVRRAITQSELDDLIAASGGTRLTTNPGPDESPVWSPDGTKIFFETRPDVGSGRYSSECYIAVMNADGSDVTRLANGTNPVLHSGTVYFEYHDPVYTDLLVTEAMDLDGSNKKKLLSLNERTHLFQAISPDRTKVCYCTYYETGSYFVWWKNATVTKEKGDWDIDRGTYNDAWQNGEILMAGQEMHSDIWVMNLDESNKVKLASGIESSNCPPRPEWSADGKKIFFLNPVISPETRIENIDIWVMDANGGNKLRLTDHPGYDADPKFSPDGTKITYLSEDQDNFDIWMMNPDGSGKERLTESPGADADIEWNPDGRRVAYISRSSNWYSYKTEHDFENTSNIWVMNIDGSDKERLLSIPYPYGVICDIEWSPDGSKMIFGFQLNYGNDDIYVLDVPEKPECAVDAIDLSPQTPVHPPETDNSTEDFLFFEVCMLPPEGGDPDCQYLVGAGFIDFPTYYFDESTGSLYTDIAPDPYDIEFNESLRFIIGESAIGRKSGEWSHLEPVYGVPYSFYLSYSTDMSAIGKIDMISITRTGLLVIHFDGEDIGLAPGDDWSRQVGVCGEQIYIINHGFLDKSTNNKTSRTRRPLD
ncbi:MAG: hypothetical protein U9Q37_06430 [Euryarchaeota archaeon]|nr:hypothetical protein [Euryarchaeota archaeon]